MLLGLIIIGVFVIVLAGGVVIGGVVVEHRHLVERVAKLEEANQKRMNYGTLADVENAGTALVLADKFADDLKVMIENAVAHLDHAHNPKEKDNG